MAGQASIVQEGVERVSEAFDSINDEFQRVQKRVRSRRRNLEKQMRTQRRDFEKETRKQVKKLRTEMRKNPALKRVRSAIEDVQKRFESGVDAVVGTLGMASKADVARLDRKIGQINRKLKELEKARAKSNGAAASV